MRVLHLIDDRNRQAGGTTLALLAASLGRLGDMEQQAVLLGGRSLQLAAQRAGIRDAILLGVPGRTALLGGIALRRRLRGSEWARPDVIHCWSAGCLALATLLWPGAAKALSLTLTPRRRTCHWLRFLVSEAAGPTVLLPISNTIRRAVIGAGVPAEQAPVVRPGLDFSLIPWSGRDAIRARWSEEGEPGSVVALLSDPPAAGDAHGGLHVIGLAAIGRHQQQRSIHLLVHPDQHRLQVTFHQRNHLTYPVPVIDERRLSHPWTILPGCDAVLARGDDAGGLSLLWAMAAGVPIVGEATYAISEVLEDRHSALLTRPGAIPAMADRLNRLFDDRQLCWQLRDTARHEAYSFFSRQHYCRSLSCVYEQLLKGEPVQPPPLSVTGGLRFTGRA